MIQLRSIQAKLGGFSAMALLLVLAAAAAGWWSIDRLSEATRQVEVIGKALSHQQDADMMHDAIRGDVLAALLAAAQNDSSSAAQIKKDEAEHVAQFSAALAQLDALPLDAQVRAAAQRVRPSLKTYEASAAQVLQVALSGATLEKAELVKFQDVFKLVEDDMEALSELLGEQTSLRLSEAQEATSITRYVTLGVASVATILLFAVGAMLARGIARPIVRALAVAEAVASGDLTARIEVDGADETSRLLQALQKMNDSLLNIVGQVRGATDNIGVASSQITSGNQDLSARTEQAASNLQQTAGSMEQLTSAVRQSADAARQANQLAASASEIAVRGGQVVGQVVATMEEINRSSQKINDIIGVIDGIAFQTNILALNAAVEAARAGEQGRGFAVVAAEVRNLAQRSAEAAKEIKGLIGTSVDKVQTGSRLVAHAGQTMSEIVGSVRRVSDIIGEITAAAGEQSDGIGLVNTAVNQLDQMTQQNAALVEESAAAAESLKDQANRLSQVVQVFRIDVTASSAMPVQGPLAPAPSAPAPARQTRVALARSAAASAAKAAAPVQAPSDATPSRTSAPPPPSAKLPLAAGEEGDWENF